MKTFVRRWGHRLWGAFVVLCVLVLALWLVAATLFSNMDRFSATFTCLVVVSAGIGYLCWVWDALWPGPVERAERHTLTIVVAVADDSDGESDTASERLITALAPPKVMEWL